MRRPLLVLFGLACLAVPTAACFRSIVFGGEQFAFRDAGHFYYPLYQRVQQEWDAGRWPLWAPEENAGMPLLGNPTAAVLYPGKVAFHLPMIAIGAGGDLRIRPISYAWGMRLYIIGHVLLAAGSMWVLTRSWGVSRAGSGVAALSYGFGMPVLFQCFNVIFLVGAAWMPLGLAAADRWLRLGRRRGLIGLAAVLALQTLGGDPQAAYLTALCAGGYGLGLARATRPGRWWMVWWAAGIQLAAFACAFGLSRFIPLGIKPNQGNHAPGPLDALAVASTWLRYAVLGGWGVFGLIVVNRWRRGRSDSPGRLLGLGVACALALALTSAQLLPVLEFTSQSVRAAEGGPHDYYPFSVEPYRFVELAWPSAFGSHFLGRNSNWMGLLPPGHHETWVPSLYVGGLTLVLALGAFGFREGPPWRAWMAAVAVLASLAAVGQFAGPIWWARFVPAWADWLGPHDSFPPRAVRLDGRLRDGDLGPYWLLATALPGFGSFRYPAKLLVLVSLALSALAGIGWDRAMARRGSAFAWARAGALASAAALLAAVIGRGAALAAFRAHAATLSDGLFGPIDPRLAWWETARGLGHGTIALGLAAAILAVGRRRPGLAGALAVATLAVDLSVANARYIITLPQATLDRTPEALLRIREFEAARPHPEVGLDLYRVHRMPIWDPAGWSETSSPERTRQMITWERDTLQPKYAIPYGLQYTLTEGTTELYDLWWFFAPFEPRVDAAAAEFLKVPAGSTIAYHPRRSYDLWNTRYFLIPAYPGRWKDEQRSYASFLPRSTVLHPDAASFRAPGGDAKELEWLKNSDWQLLRNETALPRAWVVHQARFMKPLTAFRRGDYLVPMRELIYEENPFWHEPNLTPTDPLRVAWLDQGADLPRLPGGPPGDDEAVAITRYEPQRVELDVRLNRPGVVILSDVYFPGWKLALDDKPAEILRANRLMRGAAVPSGPHHLVYTYEPGSFRIGATLSLAALLVWSMAAAWTLLRPTRAPSTPGRDSASLPDRANPGDGL